MSNHSGYAVLDSSGVIVSVSDAWINSFTDPDGPGVGDSYRQIVDHLQAGLDATETIRAALAGAHPLPVAAHGVNGWWMLVSSRYDDNGVCVGATVSLSSQGSSQESPDAHVQAGGQTGGQTALTFPDVPRLELEKTLTELTAQAQSVLKAQGRLRALLRANAVVVGELNLRVVLRHIVEAARELVGARYAALGVLAADGSLEEFVHDGMDVHTVARIGQLPRGGGILGLLIAHPEPVRLLNLGTHPASVGFPAEHPPMGTFLGVPIRVRDKVFGNLYLTESNNGEFSAEDEQLALSLAGTAGVAIENARLYRDSERRRRWQAMSTEATQRLFTGADADPLEVVLRFAMEGAEADFAILTRAEGDELLVDSYLGAPAPEMVQHRMALSDSVVEPALRSAKPVLVPDYARHERAVESTGRLVGSLVAAPLLDDERVVAAVVVGRHRGKKPFDETDLDQLAGFTGHTGVALRLDRSRVDQEALAMLREHDRIAANLHDHVIKDLFSTGMGMLGMAQQLESPAQQSRLIGYVDALDETIRRIRTTIYQRPEAGGPGQSLQELVLAVLDQERPALGLAAHIEFAGSPGGALPLTLTDDILAVVRSALFSTARDADTRSVTVRVDVGADLVTLDVVDDGEGLDAPDRSSGLADLRNRAERNNGSLELESLPDGGTRLLWTAHHSSPAKAEHSGDDRGLSSDITKDHHASLDRS